MTETANLHLPLLAAAQAQKHVTVNEALGRLDGLVQAVAEALADAPPEVAQEGQVWIVGPGAAADWAGWDGDLALWQGGGWVRLAARDGWRIWDRAAGVLRVRLAGVWVDLAQALGVLTLDVLRSGAVSGLGINAASDATNGFVFRGTNALLTSDSGIDATFNKAADWADATVSFKTGYAPRALMGLLGNDDFSLKVGPGYVQAMRVNHRSGRMAVRALQVGARPWNAVTRNRLRGGAWQTVPAASEAAWSGIDWADDLGLFCAVAGEGAGARIMTSADGRGWRAADAPAVAAWSAVIRAPELGCFVAVAGGGDVRAMTSNDGVSWTGAEVPARVWSALALAPELGRVVAVARGGNGNRAMWSGDGAAWTLASTSALAWRGVVWAAELGLFVAVAATGEGARVMTSEDGAAWTLREGTDGADWTSVAWSPAIGRLVAVAEAGGPNHRVMVSENGTDWALAWCPEGAWQSVRWVPEAGLFVAVGPDGAMTSEDGYTWARLAGVQGAALAWAPELGCLALPEGGTVRISAAVVPGDSFETVARNLAAHPAVFERDAAGNLTRVIYDLGAGRSITKTLVREGDVLVRVDLSGDTPPGIARTKTLQRDAEGRLAGIGYS